jgi:hypothetical protein
MQDLTLAGQLWGMPVNLTGRIAINLVQPWYISIIGSIITGAFAFFGVFFSIMYYKKKDKEQARLEVISKGGVIVDLFDTLKKHYLYDEKLRLGLEIDKCYCYLGGIDKIVVDKIISESSNFALYKDGKNRTEDVKLQLIRSLEQFWTAVNKSLPAFPNKGRTYKNAQSVGESIQKFTNYRLVSIDFVKVLENDYAMIRKDAIQKAPYDWAADETEKMNKLIEDDRKALTSLVADIDTKIRDLSESLNSKRIEKKADNSGND